jgi:hypothetical protein
LGLVPNDYLVMDLSVARPPESSVEKFCLHRGSLGAWSGAAVWCMMGN